MDESKEIAAISLKQFLEGTPPGKWRPVTDVPEPNPPGPALDLRGPTRRYPKKFPVITLHCTNCDGDRTFESHTVLEIARGNGDPLFAPFFCRNCNNELKTFAIWIMKDESGTSKAFKFGENPPFGKPVPSKLIELIRPEWDYFLAGRRAENQGLGIGAFAYYRRVIENQKNRILDEIIKAARKLNGAPEVIADLEAAKLEGQFKKAVEGVKHGLPDALLISGANPITLLHSALSAGLHGKSDEDCLASATDIRIVMSELAERLASVLKDDEGVRNAVARLIRMNRE